MNGGSVAQEANTTSATIAPAGVGTSSAEAAHECVGEPIAKIPIYCEVKSWVGIVDPMTCRRELLALPSLHPYGKGNGFLN